MQLESLLGWAEKNWESAENEVLASAGETDPDADPTMPRNGPSVPASGRSGSDTGQWSSSEGEAAGVAKKGLYEPVDWDSFVHDLLHGNLEQPSPRIQADDKLGVREGESRLTFFFRVLGENFIEPERSYLNDFFVPVANKFCNLYWAVPFYHSKAESNHYDVWAVGLRDHFKAVLECITAVSPAVIGVKYSEMYLGDERGLLNTQHGYIDTYCRALKSLLPKLSKPKAQKREIKEVAVPNEQLPLICHILGARENDRMRTLFEAGYRKLSDGTPDLSEIPERILEKTSFMPFLLVLASGRYNNFLRNDLRKELLSLMNKNRITEPHLEAVKEILELLIHHGYPSFPPFADFTKLPILTNIGVARSVLGELKSYQ